MSSNNKNKTDFIDIKGLLANYWAHWWWFAISIAVCGILAVIFVKTNNPEYQVRANVVISQDDDGIDAASSMGAIGNLFGASANVQDEIYVIASHSVLRDVARDLGINRTHIVKSGILHRFLAYPKIPVDVYPAPGIVDTLMTSIVFKTTVYPDGTADVVAKEGRNTIADVDDAKLPVMLNTSYGKFVINKTAECPKDEKVKSTIILSGYDVTAEDLAKDVSATMASKKSNVIELGLQTTNTDYGRDVLNEIINKYNARGIAEKNRRGEKTLAFIDRRLAMISSALDTAERNIQGYKQSRGIIDVGTEANYNMQARSVAEQALVKAQTESEIIKMTRDFLTQPKNAYELIPPSGDISGVTNTINTYNGMIMRRMDLMRNARGNNKQLKLLNEQIDAMRSSINTALVRAYETSLVSIRDAQAELSKAQGKLGNVPAQEKEFLSLKRQQEVKQQLYLFLLQRREETAMMIENAVPKGQIVDQAYSLAEPVSLGKFKILAIAILIGLFIPILLLYLQRFTRTKFETKKELEAITDVPILGEMCTDKTGRTLIVSPTDTSSTSELFRLIRTNLRFVLNDLNDKVVLVTSTRSGEGKSFISINLAASLALLGKRVILVGMDIRSPRLARYMDLGHHTGLTQYLANPSIGIDAIIQQSSEAPGLDVIQAGPIPPNPGELLASEATQQLFEQLRERYDFVIVDTAPVGMVSDTFLLARISDATIYVTRAKYTTLRDVEFINSIYNDRRLKKMSLVVNGTTAHKGYGYGYGSKEHAGNP